MAQRMLHVPMALISVVEDDTQWCRSAQGLSILLCRLNAGRFCVLFASFDNTVLREQIAAFRQEPGYEPFAGGVFTRQLEFSSAGLRLKAEYVYYEPLVVMVMAMAMARLAEAPSITSVLR
jgi:hypothetical protein